MARVIPPAGTRFEPDDPASREMGEAAEDESNADDARRGMFGDAEVLGDSSLNGLTWSVFKLSEPGSSVALGPQGRGIYWCRMHGPLDLEVLRGRLGGGTFRLLGRGDDPVTGQRMRIAETVSFFGAAKGPPPVEPAAGDYSEVAPAGNGTDPLVAQMIREIRRLRREVRQQPPATPAPDPFAMLERITAVMRNLSPANAGANGEKMVEFGLNMLERGVKLGETREGGESSIVDDIAKLGPIIKDVAQVVLTRRAPVAPARRAAVSGRPASAGQGQPPATPAGAAASAGPSSATVEGDGAPEGETTMVNPHRIASLVDTLARGIARQTRAAQLAYSAEDLLSDEELLWIRQQTPEQVSALLAQHFPSYSVFATDAGKKFIGEFVAALNMDEGERDAVLGADLADDEDDENEESDGDEDGLVEGEDDEPTS